MLVTTSAQHFDFAFTNVEEVEFETASHQQNGQSAVLALDDLCVSVVPEPASLALLAAGMTTLLAAGVTTLLAAAVAALLAADLTAKLAALRVPGRRRI